MLLGLLKRGQINMSTGLQVNPWKYPDISQNPFTGFNALYLVDRD